MGNGFDGTGSLRSPTCPIWRPDASFASEASPYRNPSLSPHSVKTNVKNESLGVHDFGHHWAVWCFIDYDNILVLLQFMSGYVFVSCLILSKMKTSYSFQSSFYSKISIICDYTSLIVVTNFVSKTKAISKRGGGEKIKREKR